MFQKQHRHHSVDGLTYGEAKQCTGFHDARVKSFETWFC
jgi:hypothetical protein